MKFKPNMYIRTKDGYIAKIDKVGDTEEYGDSKEPVTRLEVDIFYQKAGYNGSFYVYSDWVAKVSHNIIDLIKIGDYVNGYLVTTISDDAYGNKIVCVGQRLSEESGYYRIYYNGEIKTVVTKEQFEREAYKVE